MQLHNFFETYIIYLVYSSLFIIIKFLKIFFMQQDKTYWHPLQEAASINVDPLFGNFVVVDVELKEDLMVNWYVVKLEDPYYIEE